MKRDEAIMQGCLKMRKSSSDLVFEGKLHNEWMPIFYPNVSWLICILFKAVPNLEKLGVKSLTVFQRTACWSPPRLDYLYPEFVKKMFAWLPFTNIAHRYFIFWRNEARYRMIFATDGIISKVHKYFYCSEFKVTFLHKSSIKFGMLHSNSFSSRYLLNAIRTIVVFMYFFL